MTKNIFKTTKNASFLMVRHGESIWNYDSIFTGWSDIPLTNNGIKHAMNMGEILNHNKLFPKIIFTSMLDRTLQTSKILVSEFKDNTNDNSEIKIEQSWRLNEKHYGYLNGVKRKKIRDDFGEQFTRDMRKSYTMFPPITDDRLEHQKYPIYQNTYYNLHPQGESKKMMLRRLLPYWYETVLPCIRLDMLPLICTHKHTARVLMKHLKQIPDDSFHEYELPDKTIMKITLNIDGFLQNEEEINYENLNKI